MKQKTLFDHIKQITTKSDTDYYTNLSDENKKTYNVYMINRYLSMEENYIELVNEIQQYSQQLKQDGIHRVYDELIPKTKIYFNYVKSSNEAHYNQKVVELLVKYYEISNLQAKEYYAIFLKTDKQALLNIVKKYGVDDKEYKKIEKDITNG